MSKELAIVAEWETLTGGSPEERACYAAIEVSFGDICLTRASDPFVNRIRDAPLLSGYHLAEWIAWNWWRLRWEPRNKTPDWPFAHRLSTIGAGYVWPNITIFSDGERIALIAKPSPSQSDSAFYYLSDAAAVLSGRDFEDVVDVFVEQVRGQLRANSIDQTNLDRIWEDVCSERNDPQIAKRRKLEALLGRDPDEADARAIEKLLLDGREVGEEPMNEVAADAGLGGEIYTIERFRELAQAIGFESRPREVVRLSPGTGLPRVGEAPAWLLGSRAAELLRDQQRLGSEPLSNGRLAELSGISSEALAANKSGGDIAFALDQAVNRGRLVLRSKWETGRRFEVARLLGDRIVAQQGGRLFPATRSRTYRQQMQRAFAAELLSPFEAVDELLDGDYSAEKREDAADHFNVSELQIRTLLVNHRRLLPEELEPEFHLDVA